MIQPPRNLSSISVETLAMAALCQAFDPGLPYEFSPYIVLMIRDVIKLYNYQLQIYGDPSARAWLENMAERMVG